MARGNAKATLCFLETHEAQLAAVVRGHLRAFGRWDLLRDPDEVAGVVHDAAFAIAERAGGWSPAGAAPWVWADRAIRSQVARSIGHATVEFPEQHEATLGAVVPGPAIGAEPSLEDLAESFPQVGLLVRAIDEVGSPRDRQVHIEYRVQKSAGDHSPAHTVGQLFDLTPANVRQIDLRMRRRLRALAVRDERYRPLLGLAWLAA
jgi:hypothetical protein